MQTLAELNAAKQLFVQWCDKDRIMFKAGGAIETFNRICELAAYGAGFVPRPIAEFKPTDGMVLIWFKGRYWPGYRLADEGCFASWSLHGHPIAIPTSELTVFCNMPIAPEDPLRSSQCATQSTSPPA